LICPKKFRRFEDFLPFRKLVKLSLLLHRRIKATLFLQHASRFKLALARTMNKQRGLYRAPPHPPASCPRLHTPQL